MLVSRIDPLGHLPCADDALAKLFVLLAQQP